MNIVCKNLLIYILSTFFCISAIQSQDVEWYTALTSNLTEAQVKSLGEICVLADQRLAARESKKIEQQGGKSVFSDYYNNYR